MVTFNDRRDRTYNLDEVLSNIPVEHGETVGKNLVDGRFLVRGVPTDEGRRYMLDELLPNGSVIHHEALHESRSVAKRVATTTAPTRVYEL